MFTKGILMKKIICLLTFLCIQEYAFISNSYISFAETIYDLSKTNELRHYAEKAYNEYYSGNYNAAISDFSNALMIHKTPDGYLYRGYSYLKTKQYELAKKDFNMVIALCQYYNDRQCREYSFYAADLLNLLK